MVTARPQAMLIDSVDPAVHLLKMVCATTPTPKTLNTKVPRNSASISQTTPRVIEASVGIGPFIVDCPAFIAFARERLPRVAFPTPGSGRLLHDVFLHASAFAARVAAPMPYILALDQGTTSSRAIIFDRDGAIK